MNPTSYAGAPPKTSKRLLLKSGGEGAVYVQDDRAIKIYHRPTIQRQEKLQAFLARSFHTQLPPNALAPQRLHKDRAGRVNGFEMALLPPTTLPWKKLAQFNFCKQQGLTLEEELDLLLAVHRDLQDIHAAGLIVGDLNDHNIFVDLPAAQPSVYWIDVDSYQFERFPCPVALLPFLDPRLYNVPDFSAKPVFSRESDWYAFAVLMYKTILKTHPYGGVHSRYKTLQARAQARISVLHPSVTYPQAARPPTVLDGSLLSHLRQVFEKGERGPVPHSLLETLKESLTTCPRCHEAYAASRPQCPYCQRQSPRVKAATVSGALRVRTLLRTPGIVCQVFVRPSGRVFTVTRQNNAYHLLTLDDTGILDEISLFTGQAGARFALFQDILVVNPPGRRDLLLIKIENGSAQQLAVTNSERVDGETIFTATPHALYRLANGYIVRSQVRRGKLLEDVVATAYRHRTRLWASPHGDQVAGLHSLFDRPHFFLLDGGAREHSLTPGATARATVGAISDVDVAWGPHEVAFLWQETRRGRLSSHVQIYDCHGARKHESTTEAPAPPFDRLGGRLVAGTTLLHPTDDGVLKVKPQNQTLLRDLAPFCSTNAALYWHPRGLLIHQASSLLLAEATTP